MKKTTPIIFAFLAVLALLCAASRPPSPPPQPLPLRPFTNAPGLETGAPQRAVIAPATNRTISITFDAAPLLFTNKVTQSQTLRVVTNGFIYWTNITTTITEVVPVKQATNYLITLTPGTNWYAASTNIGSVYRTITNQSPASIIVPSGATNYIASGWAYLADGAFVPIGMWRFPSQPTNVITVRAWLLWAPNVYGVWSKQLLLGEYNITNATGDKVFQSELEEISTDYAPKMRHLSRSVFTF